MKACLLGIDIGTSACKAALFSQSGQVLSQVSRQYPVHYPHPGWAEQNPDDWWQAACSAIREVIDSSGAKPGDIAGIGVAGQSWSAILVGPQGEVLLPTPIWTDTRALKECEEIARLVPEETLFSCCGNPLRPEYSLPKVKWYQRCAPDAYGKAASVLQSNSFIVYRLTGRVTQDISQGYGFSCFDTRKGRWDEEIIKRLDIRRELLPAMFASHETAGTVSSQAAKLTGLLAGTPVVAGGLDAACSTLGAGVIHHGQTQEQGGQAGGMSICLSAPVSDRRLILGCHVVPGRWLLQGGSTGGGGALKWLRDQLSPQLSFAQMSDLAATVKAGSEGVLFLPYMAGERSPLWNPNACGVFFGLDNTKTSAHLIRAVMEGVAFSLQHNLQTAQQAGTQVRVLRATGGSANSLVWTQLKADITGRDIEVSSSDTTTTLGAALLAGVGTGLYPDFEAAVGRTVGVLRTHQPNADNTSVYARQYRRYLELVKCLAPMMTKEAEL